MISVWVVDDHAIIRQGIQHILHKNSDSFRVTQEASNVAELFELLGKHTPPELLILDLSMPGKSGLDALNELKEHFPKVPVLIMSMHSEDQYALRTFKAGAAGYLSKECTPHQLIHALTTILKGEKYITSRVAELLTSSLTTPPSSKKPHEILSDREFQILVLIAQGYSLTDIAKKFFLSVKTVSTYRSRILKKMAMQNNADLIQYAIVHRLIASN